MLLGFACAAGHQEVFVVAIARRARTRAEMDETIRLDRQILTDLLDKAEKFILNDQDRGLCILDDIPDFLADQAEVDRQRDKAGLGGRSEDFTPFDAIVAEDRDAIALGQAEAEQGVGESARTLVPLRERHRTFEIARANAIGRQTPMYRQHLSEIQQVLHVPLLCVRQALSFSARDRSRSRARRR